MLQGPGSVADGIADEDLDTVGKRWMPPSNRYTHIRIQTDTHIQHTHIYEDLDTIGKWCMPPSNRYTLIHTCAHTTVTLLPHPARWYARIMRISQPCL